MYRLKTKLWIYNAEKAAWHFLTLDKKLAAKIKAAPIPKSKGWGSIRVMVTIGETQWKTSIFPTKEGEYLLPVKASVRKKEDLSAGDMVQLVVEPILL